jgi:hypothetical protein
MRADELHQHAAIAIGDMRHEPKLVAADIEDRCRLPQTNITPKSRMMARRTQKIPKNTALSLFENL